jgi:hypothetical protein
MTITSAINANTILNRVAAEVGLEPVADPYSSQEQHFTQMAFLLQTAGEELSLAFQWEFLNERYQLTTVDTDTGNYPLPDDFMYMIPQTGWERAENVPLFGPLSAQDWTYLLGRDLVTYTIYASFRLRDGEFSIFPQPPPNGLDINFEYQRRTWVQDGAQSPAVYKADVITGSDIPLFDRTLVTRYVKLKWLESKGFDTTIAQRDFNQSFNFLTGKDKSGEILNAGSYGRGFPYLDGRFNIPDTGFGRV